MSLRADALFVDYGGADVLTNVSITFEPGQIAAIIGANGSGKSTLLSVLAGLIKPRSGCVKVDDQPIASWHRLSLARNLAILPQMPTAPPEMTVRELVSHGRFSHRQPFSALGAEDRDIINEALALTDMASRADHRLGALSGGEQRRAWFALTLAQSPRWLLLDEPTSHLDLGHQYKTLDLIQQVSKSRGIATIVVLHDIQQAVRVADRVIALSSGSVVADGAADAVVTPDVIAALFDLSVDIEWRCDGLKRHPIIIPKTARSVPVSPSASRTSSGHPAASFTQPRESK